ncbi:hypothetical protein SAMN05421863_108911 [Nitrosomonas communis]|uniref:Uncharacterized protein n=1 Tax=Nitrosomonas communis TaxID=44574 RepID=A0A1I4VRS2_9PROT|nr:hypothetical protein SAMN05421863_108911 [Nitrosomonas communis]
MESYEYKGMALGILGLCTHASLSQLAFAALTLHIGGNPSGT